MAKTTKADLEAMVRNLRTRAEEAEQKLLVADQALNVFRKEAITRPPLPLCKVEGPERPGPCGKRTVTICPEHLEVERKAANDYAEALKREIDGLRQQLRVLGDAVERADLVKAKLAALAADARLEGRGWTLATNTEQAAYRR